MIVSGTPSMSNGGQPMPDHGMVAVLTACHPGCISLPRQTFGELWGQEPSVWKSSRILYAHSTDAPTLTNRAPSGSTDVRMRRPPTTVYCAMPRVRQSQKQCQTEP